MSRFESIATWLHRRADIEPPLWLHIVLRAIVVLWPITMLQVIWTGDPTHYFFYLDKSMHGLVPYRDYQWEFPPLTLVLLLPVALSFGVTGLFVAYIALLAVCAEVWTLRLVRNFVDPTNDDPAKRARLSWYWLGVFVPISMISYFRLDWFATAFAASALVGLFANKTARTVWGIVLNFGIKMWSWVMFVPLIARRRFGTAAIAFLVSILMLVAWRLITPEGFNAFWAYRKGSEFQVESIPGSLVVLLAHKPTHMQYGAWMISDDGWKWLQPAMPALFVVLAITSLAIAWFRKVNQVALLGALVVLMLLTSRLISPQYMVWLAPFVGILCSRDRITGWLGAVSIWATIVVIVFYDQMRHAATLPDLVLVFRNLVLCVLAVRLFVLAFRGNEYDIESKALPFGLEDRLTFLKRRSS